MVVVILTSETVKDLIRFLRRDTDECDIRRQLGEAEIVSTDLLPIVKQYHDDRILFDTVIRLLKCLSFILMSSVLAISCSVSELTLNFCACMFRYVQSTQVNLEVPKLALNPSLGVRISVTGWRDSNKVNPGHCSNGF